MAGPPRKLVTSTGPSGVGTITVPWCRPIGTARGKISSTTWGGAAVARSKSRTARPVSSSRTQPPTT
jgi:hypothetical protein